MTTGMAAGRCKTGACATGIKSGLHCFRQLNAKSMETRGIAWRSTQNWGGKGKSFTFSKPHKKHDLLVLCQRQ